MSKDAQRRTARAIPPAETWLTQAEVNDLVRGAISKGTWANLRSRREFVYRQVARTVQYEEASVLAYLESRTVRPFDHTHLASKNARKS